MGEKNNNTLSTESNNAENFLGAIKTTLAIIMSAGITDYVVNMGNAFVSLPEYMTARTFSARLLRNVADDYIKDNCEDSLLCYQRNTIEAFAYGMLTGFAIGSLTTILVPGITLEVAFINGMNNALYDSFATLDFSSAKEYLESNYGISPDIFDGSITYVTTVIFEGFDGKLKNGNFIEGAVFGVVLTTGSFVISYVMQNMKDLFNILPDPFGLDCLVFTPLDQSQAKITDDLNNSICSKDAQIYATQFLADNNTTSNEMSLSGLLSSETGGV